MSQDDKSLSEALIALLKRAEKTDQALREHFAIGDKFRFIRDKLASLSEGVATSAESDQTSTRKTSSIKEDEQYVYVYLFNTQGANIDTWASLIHPAAFYEHSVNRPIYLQLEHVQAFLRAAKTKPQHGFLKVIISKNAILPHKNDLVLKDAYDQPLTKVKEGALKFERCVGFFHNDVEYEIDSKGKLIKKA